MSEKSPQRPIDRLPDTPRQLYLLVVNFADWRTIFLNRLMITLLIVLAFSGAERVLRALAGLPPVLELVKSVGCAAHRFDRLARDVAEFHFHCRVRLRADEFVILRERDVLAAEPFEAEPLRRQGGREHARESRRVDKALPPACESMANDLTAASNEHVWIDTRTSTRMRANYSPRNWSLRTTCW